MTNQNYSAIRIDISERRVQKTEKGPRVTVRTDQICISRNQSQLNNEINYPFPLIC